MCFSHIQKTTQSSTEETICLKLRKAIEESRISLIVFSKNYTASRWCLDELVKILECRKTLQQIVLPIFYDVDPSDVQMQKWIVAEAFSMHEDRFRGSDGKLEKRRESLPNVCMKRT